MAVKLTQAADTGLITAATRAGLAGAPASYSGTFEKVAKSYEKTMKAQGQMWKDIGKVVGVIGADMVANANEFIDYRAKGAALNPDSAKKLVLDLDANKQAQKDLGFGAGIFGDKETRQRKRELKMEQAELFAEIDMATESINTGAEAVAAGLYDHELAPQDAEMINAIIKSNLKDTFTKNGSQAVLSREEKTNKLMFSLLDRNGNAITDDATGNPITMTMEEFNKSITTNIKDTKNVLGTGMSAIESEIAKVGQTSKSGIIDNELLQASLNNLDGLLQTDVDIKRAMLSKYGFSNTSFADDIKTKSKVSEDVYAALVKSIGQTKGGQVKAEGVLANIDDTDGILGLSQEEINMSYGVYSANILGMKDPEISKEVFKASYADRMREAHKFGYSKRQVETSDGGGGSESNFGVKPNQHFGSFVDNAGQSRSVYGNDVLNTIEAFKNAIDGKVTTFRGHDDKTYVIRNGRFIAQSGANKGEAVNINTIINSLKINNLPGIYDYLKPAKSEFSNVDINFINFNNDRDGDGIPNSIDKEPDNPNN